MSAPSPPTRRSLLRQASALGTLALAGCVSQSFDGGNTPADTPTCSATPPPKPTAANAAPKAYPTRPDRLTTQTVRSYVRDYEHAYQYNKRLAAHSEKIGRLNDLTVNVREVAVDTTDSGFRVEVSGEFYYGIVDHENATPATPTQTPLPMGHGPFSTTYVITDRLVRRAGVVRECW